MAPLSARHLKRSRSRPDDLLKLARDPGFLSSPRPGSSRHGRDRSSTSSGQRRPRSGWRRCRPHPMRAGADGIERPESSSSPRAWSRPPRTGLVPAQCRPRWHRSRPGPCCTSVRSRPSFAHLVRDLTIGVTTLISTTAGTAATKASWSRSSPRRHQARVQHRHRHALRGLERRPTSTYATSGTVETVLVSAERTVSRKCWSTQSSAASHQDRCTRANVYVRDLTTGTLWCRSTPAARSPATTVRTHLCSRRTGPRSRSPAAPTTWGRPTPTPARRVRTRPRRRNDQPRVGQRQRQRCGLGVGRPAYTSSAPTRETDLLPEFGDSTCRHRRRHGGATFSPAT